MFQYRHDLAVGVSGLLHAEPPAYTLRENSTFEHCYFSGGLPIDSSLLFLESKRDTYQKYITASENVVERCLSALSFYRKKISLKREQLDSISIDLTSPSAEALRSKYEKLAEIKFRKNELKEFSDFLSSFRNDLKEIRIGYVLLEKEEKRLRNLKSVDEEKVKNFKNTFLNYLDSFGYRSNGVYNITINDDSSHRLLPIVRIESQQPQYIRYVSSASDFVRSIWAYYIALLNLAENHPGFLVMDEPGQHQMRVDSMQVLLKLSANLGKQFILAISQDRKYDSKNVNIYELVKDISDKDYTLHHIEDNQSCISLI
ncbi:hypothetical protein [Marinobacterium sediminicola]|uniref:hypothetical protein n=1 Tax=Marinobacterium sediminicola TaxID=518898 RepID=UPI001EF07506|nr:hypothetical protein [Marinobacterium sediminicola]ULG69238.1 hypothetical protein LN244_00025 [Marinobacterium sediminicola]